MVQNEDIELDFINIKYINYFIKFIYSKYIL